MEGSTDKEGGWKEGTDKEECGRKAEIRGEGGRKHR